MKFLFDTTVTENLKTYGLYDMKRNSPIAVAGGNLVPVGFTMTIP